MRGLVRAKYCEALKAEVQSFSESIREKVREGISGSGLVSAVVEEWEQVVKKVAKAEVVEKVVVCGRAVRWWDDEIKQKIEHRRKAYKKILEGQDNLWEEYSKLRREVNNLVVQKKLEVWNEVVERANSDFEGNRKEFWALLVEGQRVRGGGLQL